MNEAVKPHKVNTNICLEQAKDDNPFVCSKQFLAGYNTLELAKSRSFTEVLFLLFNLDLPNTAEKKVLEMLMVGLINPGPRHPATKAAIAAGLSKANPEHILPIATSTIGGERGGAKEVLAAHKFIRAHIHKDAERVTSENEQSTESRFAPGFGHYFGDIDEYIQSLARQIQTEGQIGAHTQWAMQLNHALKEANMGILDVGLAAAIFCDLGIGERESVALYQFMRAPGMIAHGLEQTHRPVTDVPLLEDEHYVYSPNQQK